MPNSCGKSLFAVKTMALVSAAIVPFVFLLVFGFVCALPVAADVISPSIDREQEVYSSELPNGRLLQGAALAGACLRLRTCASTVSSFCLKGATKTPIECSVNAVQLDPGDPTGHVLLARSMTGLLRKADGSYDEDMLNRVVKEWKMIAYHDADISEQFEAKGQLRKLGKIVKALKKEKLEKKELEQKDSEQRYSEAKEQWRQKQVQPPSNLDEILHRQFRPCIFWV